MRVPAKPEDIIEAYIDESSQNKHRFLVLGVVIFRMTSAQKFNDLIATARLPELPQGEAKWTKVSKAKLAAYKRLVDVLFDNPEEIHFHSLFVDTTQQDHKSYNEGDEEIGFNKEVYQLANKIITGAIAFQLNGHDKAENANPAKIELAKYIMQRAGIADVTKGTARTGKFTIWPRQLKKK
jgi:hypothetical protein